MTIQPSTPPKKNPEQREVAFRVIGQVQQLAELFTKRRGMKGITTEHFMPSMFADEQRHTRGAVSKIIRILLEKKFVTVAVSTQDGRQQKYELTPKGRKTMDSTPH